MTRRARRPPGTGTLSRRADGRWVVALSLGRDPTTGRRQRRVAYARTEAEARARLQALLRQYHRGDLAAGPAPTVAAWLHHWLRTEVQPTCTPRTLALYTAHVRHRFLPAFGSLRLDQLTPSQVQAAYARWLAAGLAPRTLRTAHQILHAALRRAVRQGLLARAPTAAVRLPRPQAVRPVQALDPAALARLEAAARALAPRWPWLPAAVSLLAWAGLRRGELLGLRWTDLRAAPPAVWVQRQAQWTRGQGQQPAPLRAARAARTVPLLPRTVAALRAWQRQAPPGPWVFANPATGRPLGGATLGRAVRAAGAAAGLPALHPHALRHTYASLLHAAGVPLAVASQLLGHARASLTLEVYTHVAAADLTAAAARLAAVGDTGVVRAAAAPPDTAS